METDRNARRVVVTGMGVIAPNGQTVPEFWSSLREGRSGIRPIEHVGPAHLRENVTVPVAGQIRGFDYKARLAHVHRDKILLHSERYSWLAAAAAHEAITQSGLALPLSNPERVAVVVGSALGGQSTVETASRDHFLSRMKATHPLVLVRLLASSAAAHLGIEYGAKGPVLGMCSACASADHAIMLGRDYIREGLVDIAIVGGTESAINYGIVLAMQSLGVLTKDTCRPFSANRTGTALSEGAGILVIESLQHARDRGAKCLAEVCGAGMTASTNDLINTDPETAAHALKDAMADARLPTSSIDYLNAFGVGTRKSDLLETQAIKIAFSEGVSRISVSSTKSMHGYVMGASGALEAVACIKSIEDGFVPPTIGLDQNDPDCDLDFTPKFGRARTVNYSLSLTLALGGMNTALIYGRPPAKG